MHPTILQQLAEAHVADLHLEAEQRRAARTARRARTQVQQNTMTEPGPTVLGRLRSVLTSHRPYAARSRHADLTPEPTPDLAQTAAGRPS